MKQLEKLIIEATVLTEPEAEVERVMQVCNACRYCGRFLRGISGDDPAARIR
ncbi:citrate utilization protein B [Salmonella enterica subsp. enterica]|nr:citrate utilization protein B [Salmonella enterica subsp. enterica]